MARCSAGSAAGNGLSRARAARPLTPAGALELERGPQQQNEEQVVKGCAEQHEGLAAHATGKSARSAHAQHVAIRRPADSGVREQVDRPRHRDDQRQSCRRRPEPQEKVKQVNAQEHLRGAGDESRSGAPCAASAQFGPQARPRRPNRARSCELCALRRGVDHGRVAGAVRWDARAHQTATQCRRDAVLIASP